jgi:hypothetical protein
LRGNLAEDPIGIAVHYSGVSDNIAFELPILMGYEEVPGLSKDRLEAATFKVKVARHRFSAQAS